MLKTVTGEGADGAVKQTEEVIFRSNKGVIFKDCAPYTDCISEINTQIDDVKDIDFVMPMYNLIEYSDNYSKTSGRLWQYYRDDSAATILNSESFKSIIKITGKTPADGNVKDVEITLPLKYLSHFRRTLEIPLINCEINLILSWSENCIISSATGVTKFAITDTWLYLSVVTLLAQDNIKLLKQLESGFKRIINWNKYKFKVTEQAQSRYLY